MDRAERVSRVQQTIQVGQPVKISSGKTVGFVAEVNHKASGEDSCVVTDSDHRHKEPREGTMGTGVMMCD